MSRSMRRPLRPTPPSAITAVSQSAPTLFRAKKISTHQVTRYLDTGKIDELIQILAKAPDLIQVRKWVSIYIDTKTPENWLSLFGKMAMQHIPIASEENMLAIARGILFAHEKLQPAKCAMLISLLFELCTPKKVAELISENPSYTPYAILALQYQPPKEQEKYYANLILEYFKNYDLDSLRELSKANTEIFARALNTLPYEKQKIHQLLLLHPITQKNLQQNKREFTHGFGNITFNGMLLSCAQIAKRKKYKFDPCIIKPEELQDHLNTIKKLPPPLRVHFIINDSHSTSGVIDIDKSGHAKLFYIDPKGAEYAHFSVNKLKSFATTFPKHTIYFSRQKRQNSDRGCSVFAIDDVRHLYTTETYLQTNLFTYLEKQGNKATQLADTQLEITICDLPSTLHRTKQSTSLFADIAARTPEEQKQVISKKGWTAKQHADHDIRDTNDPEHPKQNLRLLDKLQKLAQQNDEFILKTNPTEIEGLKQRFTLAGFKAQAAHRPQDEKQKSIRDDEEILYLSDAKLTRKPEHAGTFYLWDNREQKSLSFNANCITENATPAQRKELCILINLIYLCQNGAYDDLTKFIMDNKFDVNTTFSYKSLSEKSPHTTCLSTIAKEQHGEHSKTYQMLVKLGAKSAAPMPVQPRF